ncbi:MAG: hypothetical protein ACREFL_21960, partial [Stellaceae bacterium]
MSCGIAPHHDCAAHNNYFNTWAKLAETRQKIFHCRSDFKVDLAVILHHIVHCGIGRRPMTCRTSSRRFLPKLGQRFGAALFFWRSAAHLRG